MHFRPTQAVIDLGALKYNFQRAVKSLPRRSGILAMVKADAYGHGAIPVAKMLVRLGVTVFGVATVEEGIELRRAGIKKQILVMGGLMGGGEGPAREMIKYRLTPVIHSPQVVPLLDQLARKLKVKGKLKVHLKIDTGMSRLGVTPRALGLLLEKLKNASHLKLEGVMTHLAFRFDAKYTRYQLQLFTKMGRQILQTLGRVPVWHIANSAAVIQGSPIRTSFPDSNFWVRPGIMLYGIPPYPEFSKKFRFKLKPVMSIVSKVVLIKAVPSKTKISYNCTFTTKRPSRIGIVPIGYADGYPWSLSGKAHVLIEQKKCPVLGRVTMDMIVVDLTDCLKSKVGSEVVLMGKQGPHTISADRLAGWAGTIPYEIICRVSKRMPRKYLS